MKKTALAASLALALGASGAHAKVMTSGTFTMHSPGGGTPGLFTDVTGSITPGDGSGGSWAVASTSPFFGFTWTAHDGTTFGPGTYTFASVEGGTYTNVVVGAGQVGGHILFDWNTTTNIDVINVWDVVGDTYTSTDVAADAINGTVQPNGIRGLQMIDGAFPGFEANFDFVAPIPVPAAVWLFGSGLVGLVGVARRRRRAA